MKVLFNREVELVSVFEVDGYWMPLAGSELVAKIDKLFRISPSSSMVNRRPFLISSPWVYPPSHPQNRIWYTYRMVSNGDVQYREI